MNETEIIGIIEEATNRTKGSLKPSDILKNRNEWDSIAVIMFLTMIEEKYGIALDPGKLTKCATVADLATLVRESVATAAK
jgi:acyl carrier protein